MAILPLVGLAALTWQSVDKAQTAAGEARRTEATATEAIDLAELNAAIFDEMVWRVAYNGGADVGAPSELWEELLGIDPQVRVQETAALVDALIDTNSELEAPLMFAREPNIGVTAGVSRFEEVLAQNETDLYALLGELDTANLTTADGRPLSTKIENLVHAINLRASLAEQFYAYFAFLVQLRGTPAEEIENLITLRQDVRYAERGLLTAVSEESGISDAIQALHDDEAFAQFVTDVDEIITNAFADAVPEAGSDFQLGALLANLDAFSNALRAMTSTADPSGEVLRQAGQELIVAAQEVRTDADAELRHTIMLALALTLASGIAAVLATRFIVRPLRELRLIAEHLETNTEATLPPSVAGPTEVKAASRALYEAATHLHLVTRQARALSTGELDAEVLDEVAPGGLGSALQEAVSRLRTALTAQEESQQRLAHEATHDAMTTLVNRNAWLDALGRTMARTARAGTDIAVLFIDLDRFKAINDEYGHHAGDLVLTETAQRILDTVRAGDHVGRLGGDEFVVIADPIGHLGEAVKLAERIIDALEHPFDTEYGQLSMSASVGIATNESKDLTADELLREADLAVYRAKATGGKVEVCNEELRAELARSADKTAAIEAAIANNELVMHYQPIVDSQHATLHAFEALVRWDKPGEQGLVPPTEFIDFAEDSALILLLDRWVLDAVATQLSDWAGHPTLDIPVSINVSGRHLTSDGFVDDVLTPLRRHGIDPARVIIEVTESTLLNDMEVAALKLQELRDAGISIAIDDFGTGYTSLAHLRSLPFDILKIDRSYVAAAATNREEAAIVKLIIDTGHLLNAKITAEGIESSEEATVLAALGADYLQGFHFGQPRPPELCAQGTLNPTALERSV